MKKILFIPFLFIFFMFLPKEVFAEMNIGVYPPIFQAEATPPAELTTPLKVYNFANTPLETKIVIKPFTQSGDENGEVSFLSKSPTQEFIDKNVRVLDGENQISGITLGAKEVKELTLEIKVAKNESRSDYYFSIIFLSQSEDSKTSNTSASLGGIASNILISVGPKGPTEGEIKEFKAPFFIQNGPVPFKLKLLNSSDHFITPKGNILIKNMFGQTIAKIDLLPVNILSNTSRFVPDYQSYLLSLKDEKTKFDSKTIIWPEKFLLGPYVATLNVSFSDSGPHFKRSIYFIAFPLSALIALIITTLIVIFIIKKIKNRLNS
jgi:hypothetical protein